MKYENHWAENGHDEEQICVIVPVYNVERYLDRCVKSILNQTYGSFRLVLIDDGSTDSSGDMCDNYEKEDTRVIVIHQKNQGLSAARNSGLDWNRDHLHCRWVTFIDSDDWVHTKYLEYLLSAATINGVKLAAGLSYRTNGESLPEDDGLRVSLKMPEEYYLGRLVTVAWGKLYRAECFSEIRFPVGKIHEDEYTTYKIIFTQSAVAVVEVELYAYFQNSDGITHRPWNPRRLDVLPALEGQTDFFINNGYEETARVTFERLLASISTNQKAIMSSEILTHNEQEYYRKKLDKKIRHVLRKYYGHGWRPIYENEQNRQLYELAYPSLGSVRSLCQEIANGLKNVPVIGSVGHLLQWMWSKREKVLLISRYIKATAFQKTVLFHSPLYGNLGDHAIAEAELEFMERMNVSCVDFPSIKGVEKHLARVTPRKCLILRQGGGNLGQLWPKEEKQFRILISIFKRNKIIVFPQTIYFDIESEEGKKFFEASKRIYESHPNLTIFVREKISYDFMRKNMPDVHVVLVPDMAMLLTWKKDEDRSKNRKGVLMCLRGDKEKTITDKEREWILAFFKEQGMQVTSTDTYVRGGTFPIHRKKLVDEKLSEFAKASLVVTDRLHGMIFAAVTETPCIVLQSQSHKVRGCYEWFKDLDYICLAETIEDVPEIAKKLEKVHPVYNRSFIEKAMQPLYEEIYNNT